MCRICTLLYSDIPCSSMPYCTELCCSILYSAVPCSTVLHHTILYHAMHIVLFHVILYDTILYSAALHSTLLYSSLSYHTLLYCALLFCHTVAVLCCTVLIGIHLLCTLTAWLWLWTYFSVIRFFHPILIHIFFFNKSTPVSIRTHFPVILFLKNDDALKCSAMSLANSVFV